LNACKPLKASAFHNHLNGDCPPQLKIQVSVSAERVHSQQHIKTIQRLAQRGGGYLRYAGFNARYDVALLAVSAWLDGVDQGKKTVNQLCAGSPSRDTTPLGIAWMGFACFPNAISRLPHPEQPGIDCVAILDWDVHHGNGTQAIVENHPSNCLLLSVLFPTSWHRKHPSRVHTTMC